jgi:hypothetical protein
MFNLMILARSLGIICVLKVFFYLGLGMEEGSYENFGENLVGVYFQNSTEPNFPSLF